MYTLRIRGISEKTEVLRKTALKNGASNVITRSVAPNQDESTVIFKKKADISKFSAWLERTKDCAVFEEEGINLN